MTPRDAIITFRCFAPDWVEVSVSVDGRNIHDERLHRDPSVVTKMEENYIFFARQANIARRQIKHGQSCTFNVFFREP